VIRGVLAGVEGPALRVVLANAAAAMLAAERVRTLMEGVEQAAAAVADGRAAAVLDGLVRENGRL
jgi:anthranilate phosphoribosyltransferase